jgi:hypothetical protein
LYLLSHPAVLNSLIEYASPCETYAKCLSEVVSSFADEEYAAGKLQWLKQLSQFDFSTSATVDVWGCEQDMVLPCLRPILSNSVCSVCDSPYCPQGKKVLHRSSLLIVNGDLERLEGQTYLELMLHAWLNPPPEPCNAAYHQNPPPTARTRQKHICTLIGRVRQITRADGKE